MQDKDKQGQVEQDEIGKQGGEVKPDEAGKQGGSQDKDKQAPGKEL